MAVLVTLFLGLLIGLLYFYGQKKDPKPIFGIYTQKGKWYAFKYIVFLCMYYYRKFTAKNYTVDPKSVYTKVIAGHGVRAISDPAQHDRAQPLSDHPLAVDAVFFIGSNSDGYYAVAGCERRQMGVCHGLFYIAIPGKGLLCSKKIPDTILFGAEPDQFGCEGLLIKPVEPMKKWSVAYDGEMWFQSDPDKKIQVRFESEWIAKWKCFDYDSDLYGPAIARSIAREQWHRGYFEDLKKAHQSHIDQFGVWNTKFEFEGEKYSIELQAFRDHTFAHKRDWTLMHRYAFHHIFLENGLSASVGVVCQPSTATEFELGAVCLPNGEVHPVKWCDLKLYQHGEHGAAPRDYAYRFQAADEIYTVQVDVVYESVHYVTPNWDARMVERFVKYTVNGVPGRGVSEFHYNHTGGRPDKYAASDPEWFKMVSKRH